MNILIGWWERSRKKREKKVKLYKRGMKKTVRPQKRKNSWFYKDRIESFYFSLHPESLVSRLVLSSYSINTGSWR